MVSNWNISSPWGLLTPSCQYPPPKGPPFILILIPQNGFACPWISHKWSPEAQTLVVWFLPFHRYQIQLHGSAYIGFMHFLCSAVVSSSGNANFIDSTFHRHLVVSRVPARKLLWTLSTSSSEDKWLFPLGTSGTPGALRRYRFCQTTFQGGFITHPSHRVPTEHFWNGNRGMVSPLKSKSQAFPKGESKRESPGSEQQERKEKTIHKMKTTPQRGSWPQLSRLWPGS